MRVVALISGNGTNLQTLIDAGIKFDLVISDNADALGLNRARSAGIRALPLTLTQGEKIGYDRYLADAIGPCDLIVLAGFMRILSPWFVKHYENKILNIHPSLLPKYKGLDTHQRVHDDLANQGWPANETTHGCSVHFVDEGLDTGPVIMQAVVKVNSKDTVDQIAANVLSVEHLIYPVVVRWFVDGRLWCNDNRVWLGGREMETPIIC